MESTHICRSCSWRELGCVISSSLPFLPGYSSEVKPGATATSQHARDHLGEEQGLVPQGPLQDGGVHLTLPATGKL